MCTWCGRNWRNANMDNLWHDVIVILAAILAGMAGELFGD